MAPVSGEEMMKSGDPEQMQESLKQWTAWYDKAGSAVTDFGAPLGESAHIGETEHPKLPAHVSGYTIFQAEDMDAAKALLEDHPHLSMPHSCIEVLEMLPMPGM